MTVSGESRGRVCLDATDGRESNLLCAVFPRCWLAACEIRTVRPLQEEPGTSGWWGGGGGVTQGHPPLPSPPPTTSQADGGREISASLSDATRIDSRFLRIQCSGRVDSLLLVPRCLDRGFRFTRQIIR